MHLGQHPRRRPLLRARGLARTLGLSTSVPSYTLSPAYGRLRTAFAAFCRTLVPALPCSVQPAKASCGSRARSWPPCILSAAAFERPSLAPSASRQCRTSPPRLLCRFPQSESARTSSRPCAAAVILSSYVLCQAAFDVRSRAGDSATLTGVLTEGMLARLPRRACDLDAGRSRTFLHLCRAWLPWCCCR